MHAPPSRTRHFALVLAASALALAPPAAAESAESTAPDPVVSESLDLLGGFHGKWQRVAIEEDDEARVAAIDSALARLSWLTRKMASPILRSSTSPPADYEFVVRAPSLLMGQRGETPKPLPLDGRQHGGDGPRGAFSARSRVVEGAIETAWTVTDAEGTNRYRLADDGTTLIVEHTIQVTMLEGVDLIQYQARFQRTASVAAAGELAVE